MKKTQTESLMRGFLEQLGENPDRQGLKRTPRRMAAAYASLTRGYRQNVREIVNGAVFDEEYDEMVLVKDLDVYSLCEHHLLPFYGKCHVGYIPQGKIIGLSKVPRIVDMFARRLQVQERLTHQIANCLKETLDPLGVGVIVEAFHLCMAMRGVEKQNASCVTSAMLGVFRSDRSTRMEFMNLVNGR